MANLQYAVATRNTRLDTVAAAVDAGAGAGLFRIYDGAQPADPDVAIGGQTLLAELTMSDPAFAAATSGVLTANAITPDASANATGTATWFRVVDSDSNGVLDGDIGTTGSGADLEFNSTSITAGLQVEVTALVITEGN